MGLGDREVTKFALNDMAIVKSARILAVACRLREVACLERGHFGRYLAASIVLHDETKRSPPPYGGSHDSLLLPLRAGRHSPGSSHGYLRETAFI